MLHLLPLHRLKLRTLSRLTGLNLDNLITSHWRSYSTPAHDKGILFSSCVFMVSTLLALYWPLHNYCQVEPTNVCFFFPANKVSNVLPLVSEEAPKMSRYPHSLLRFETMPGENQVTQAAQNRRVVVAECDPTWLLRVFIASDDKVLYDFAVFTRAQRLKPYTGKAPWWPWLVKCTHFHQEEFSVQWLFRAVSCF